MKSISPRILFSPVLSLTCVFFSFGSGACYSSTGTSGIIEEQAEAVLAKEFNLKSGREVTIKGEDLKVKFDSLVEDSRCPADVKCVWEGDAKIIISVKRAKAEESSLELHTNASFSQAAKYQNYEIKLVALTPYPKTSVKEKPSDYVATLMITKE